MESPAGWSKFMSVSQRQSAIYNNLHRRESVYVQQAHLISNKHILVLLDDV